MRLYQCLILKPVIKVNLNAAIIYGHLVFLTYETKGETAYPIKKCCADLGIAVNTARRAFRILEKENLITVSRSANEIIYRVNWEHPAISGITTDEIRRYFQETENFAR